MSVFERTKDVYNTCKEILTIIPIYLSVVWMTQDL